MIDDSESASSPRRRPRRPLPPPPPLQDYEILRELEPHLASVLWRALRDVRSWAEASLEERPRLFPPAADGVRERPAYPSVGSPMLAHALGMLTVVRSAPRAASVGEVVRACSEISTWAEANAFTTTATVWAEAAAVADPENPITSIDAGKRTRNAAMYDRAEIWFSRGNTLASRQRSRREQIRALLGYGTLLREVGRVDEAKRVIAQASRLASHTRRQRQAAESAHDLMLVAILDGNDEEVLQFATEAIQSYPVHHPAVPGLVHDWCVYILRIGLHAQALPLLTQIVPLATRPDLNVLFASTWGRAGAGSGSREIFEEAVRVVISMAEIHGRWASAAYGSIAEGACALKEWDRAEAYAARAVEIAIASGDVESHQNALDILDAIATRRMPIQARDSPRGTRIASISVRLAELLERRRG